MKNILALVGAAVVAFLAVGWYLGWYRISSVPSPHGQQSVQVEINPTKITEDVKKGVEKGGQIVESLREPAADPKAAPPQGPASSFFLPGEPSSPSNTIRTGGRPDDAPYPGRGPRN